MKKVGFISLGCPKNLVDSEVMMGQLKQNGYQITSDARDADTVVVNTCGFIDAVKQLVGVLPSDRDADVWHIKKLMEAHRNGKISVLTSYLTLAECVAIETGQETVPEDAKEQFRRLLNSGQYV